MNSTKSTNKKSTKAKSAIVNDADLFPHDQFPYRLEYKDGKENKICWFQCVDHLNKHLERYHLTTNACVLYVRDGIMPKQTKRPKKEQKLFSTLDDFFT